MDEEAEQEERKQRRPRGGMMGGGYDAYGGEDMAPDMSEMGRDMYDGSAMPGGFGRPKEEEKEDETLGNRRRLLTSLNAAFFGLTGMKWSAWTVWVRRNKTDQPTEGVASLAAALPQADLVTGEKGLLKQFEDLFEACGKAKEDEGETLRSNVEAALTALTQALNMGRAPDAEEPAEAAPPADTDEPAAKSAEPAAKPGEPAAKPAVQPAGNP